MNITNSIEEKSPGTQIQHESTGLNQGEVLQLRKQFGENRLPVEKRTTVWILLLNQLKSPLVYIILVAAAVSLLLRELGDFIIIMAVVVIDVILGFIQEYQAQQTYTALKGLLKPTTTVIRAGSRQEVEVWELVPGDVVLLNSGEKVPADGQIVESTKLAADEAILTGESEPVSKSEAASHNMVFMGTTIVTGRGTMLVSKIGSSTELGKIATSLGEHVEEDTPLQVRLKTFSKVLTYIVLGFTLAILITGLFMGRGFLDMLRVSIILAIAAVPEGLLIAVTVILVLGMRKILKRQGLVKKLLAVETLGSVTVICTDKTGTLTEGRMRVSRVELADQESAMHTMVLCNDLEGPVDIALWEYASANLKRSPQDIVDSTERLAEELFTSETKYMITAVAGDFLNGNHYNYLKGAPEIVLNMCMVSDDERQHILTHVDEWAGDGLRLLGLAYRKMGTLEDYSGYTWAGLVGMQDPIRDGVHEAVELAHRAGVEVKMITGDYQRTADKIAQTIGILKPDELSLEGEEFDTMNDEQLREEVKQVAVFSRIHPEDKLRIVRALQSKGEITAMIGDGVNDAPALQQANIGVVVGSATDVAKETADLILMDSNFRTIVSAIEEGRVIFENIRKVVAYTLSNSFAEVLTIFTAMMLHWPAPLAVAQILWIHLICDGPSDIVLGFEPEEEGIMDEKPKSIKEPVLAPLGLTLIGVISIGSAIAALTLFGHSYLVHNDPVEGRSLVFASFAVNSMVYIFAYRSMRLPLLRASPLSRNKPLVAAVIAGLLMVVIAFAFPGIRELLGIVPLSPQQWGLIAAIALGLLLAVEIGKWVRNLVRRLLKRTD